MYVMYLHVLTLWEGNMRLHKTALDSLAPVTLMCGVGVEYPTGVGEGGKPPPFVAFFVKPLEHKFIPVPCHHWLLGLCKTNSGCPWDGGWHCSLRLKQRRGCRRQVLLALPWGTVPQRAGVASAASLPCSSSGDKPNFSFCSYCSLSGATARSSGH